MQKKQLNNEAATADVSAPPKRQKERRIVTWTPEEDDILREQISIHGTENWTIIASKFKDKTTRQCRRRWYTYLNSDFKKGGWSPEEDMLLCEAQKLLGNRWTEIAKVVAGRTDNAVKNRFTTLCKKRAKREALVNETSTKFINPNNKRVLVEIQGTSDIEAPLKKIRRTHIFNCMSTCNNGDMSQKDFEITKQQLRLPFAVWAQNAHNVENLQPDVYESPSSSEYSTGSTIFSNTVSEQADQTQAEICTAHKDIGAELQSVHIGEETGANMSENKLLPSLTTDQEDGVLSGMTTSEFSSPLQVTPLFRSLAATIPSPQFSESERHFLMKTLGIESPIPTSHINMWQPPPCRKALLQSL